MADEPLDTLEQVKAFGLNPRFAHSCADPQGHEVAGCSVAHLCDLPEKYRGPCNVGTRMLKPMTDGSVGIRQEILKCHTYIRLRDDLMDNGGALDIVAREGDEIEITEGVRIVDATVEGGFRYELKTDVKKIVPVHPKLRDLPKYRNRLTLADKQRERDEREKRERGSRMLGIEPEEDVARIEAHPAGVAASDRGNKAVS